VTEFQAMSSSQIGLRVCKMLGIPHEGIRRIIIDIDANDPIASIYIERIGDKKLSLCFDDTWGFQVKEQTEVIEHEI
jgi:hypothetical protein